MIAAVEFNRIAFRCSGCRGHMMVPNRKADASFSIVWPQIISVSLSATS